MFVQDITDELQNYQSVILALQEQAAALGEQVRALTSRSDVVPSYYAMSFCLAAVQDSCDIRTYITTVIVHHNKACRLTCILKVPLVHGLVVRAG